VKDYHEKCLAKNLRVQESVWRHLAKVQPYVVFGGCKGLATLPYHATSAVLEELVELGRVEHIHHSDDLPEVVVGKCFLCDEDVLEIDFTAPSKWCSEYRCLGEPRLDVMSLEVELELSKEWGLPPERPAPKKRGRKPRQAASGSADAQRSLNNVPSS
jgi:hypothetical protein